MKEHSLFERETDQNLESKPQAIKLKTQSAQLKREPENRI